MKKVLAICLMLMMLVSMSTSVFAANGGFVSSPSGNPAPKIEEVKLPEGTKGEIKVVSVLEKAELPAAVREVFEKAVETIAEVEDLSKLEVKDNGLNAIAAEKKIETKDLAVTDIFDISLSEGTLTGEAEITVAIEKEVADKFAALLHMNNGTWETVKDAKVVDGKLTFSVSSLSPFAIVVNTNTEKPVDPVGTGDISTFGIYAAIMGVSALAIAVIAVKSRKQRV